jgi:hypothetical protein
MIVGGPTNERGESTSHVESPQTPQIPLNSSPGTEETKEALENRLSKLIRQGVAGRAKAAQHMWKGECQEIRKSTSNSSLCNGKEML